MTRSLIISANAAKKNIKIKSQFESSPCEVFSSFKPTVLKFKNPQNILRSEKSVAQRVFESFKPIVLKFKNPQKQ